MSLARTDGIVASEGFDFVSSRTDRRRGASYCATKEEPGMRIRRMVMAGVAVIALGGAGAFAQGDTPGQGDAPTQADASKPAKSKTESQGSGEASTTNQRRSGDSNAAAGS